MEDQGALSTSTTRSRRRSGSGPRTAPSPPRTQHTPWEGEVTDQHYDPVQVHQATRLARGDTCQQSGHKPPVHRTEKLAEQPSTPAYTPGALSESYIWATGEDFKLDFFPYPFVRTILYKTLTFEMLPCVFVVCFPPPKST